MISEVKPKARQLTNVLTVGRVGSRTKS